MTQGDDGYTGTNFQRPEFQRLLEDIQCGKIDTVVTKDLSRLGRDQIGTLYYIQVYFPAKGVRYIAANEGMDTQTKEGQGIAVPFLAAANDFYAADISRKVRSALQTRRQNGLFIGAAAPLGYEKDSAQKGHLIPDAQTAWIVREVFQTYLSLGSVSGVARRLTEDAVPTPSECKPTGCQQKRFPGVWSDTMVRRILGNPTYAGHLTQGRTEKVAHKIKRRQGLPREQWTIAANTHEGLVDQTVFDRVQELLQIRSYLPAAGEGHVLTGRAFCADCGAPMTYVRESGTRIYMVCQSARKSGSLKLCTPHRVREDAVLTCIGEQLKKQAKGVDFAQLLETARAACKRAGGSPQNEVLARRMERCRRVSKQLYDDRASGLLTGQEFEELFFANRAARADLERRLAQQEKKARRQTTWETQEAEVKQLMVFEALDRTMISQLVEKILIEEHKGMQIWFRFAGREQE